MGVGAGLYMYDVVVTNSHLLSHLLMSSCFLKIKSIAFKKYFIAFLTCAYD